MKLTWMTALPLAALALVACKDGSGTDTNDSSGPDDSAEDTSAEQGWDPRFDDIAAAFDAERQALGAPGLAVAILEGGEITFSAGFGSGHPDEEQSITGDTLFRIGSTTKVMTALTLLQQAEEGSLSLDDTLAQRLPELEFALDPSWSEQITLQHLLTHQGAFYDWTEVDGRHDDAYLSEWTHGTFAESVLLMAPPGQFWNYSNPNFMLAGLVAEQVDAQPYRALMQERVFDPLGMQRSMFLGAEVAADGDYATGLTTNWTTGQGRALADATAYDHAASRPAGFLWSSADDMLRFADFLMHGDTTVLSEAGRLSMSTEHVTMGTYPDYGGYGYGLMTFPGLIVEGEYREMPVVTHGGAIPGFAAELWMLPEQDLAIVTLASTDGAYFREALSVAIGQLAELPAASPFPDPQLERTPLVNHVGSYMDPNNVGMLIVTEEDGQLHIEAPLLERYGYTVAPVLQQTSENNFVMGLNDLYIGVTFVENEQGAWLRTRYFVGTRSEQQASPAPNTATNHTERERIEEMMRQIRRQPLPPTPGTP